MYKTQKQYGDIVQIIGTVAIGIGVGCELAVGGELYLIMITIGSVLFAIGTKIKGQ